MSTYLGDFRPGVTLDHKFTTVTTTGAPTQLAGTPAISVYKDNDTTQTTTGVTLTVDFDTVTGLNNVRIVTTDSFYAAGSNYQIVITTGTVGGTSVVGYVVGSFSLRNRLDNIGVVTTGTAQSGTSSTIVLAAAEALGDDVVNGGTLVILSGTGAGQSRIITDYVTATDTATVDPNWGTNPDSTSVYAIFRTPPAPTATANLPKVDTAAIAGAAVSTSTAQLGVNVVSHTGNVGVKKNAALSAFMFQMFDSTNHAPATGKTVTVTRSIDGGAFGAGTLSAVTEVSGGWYKCDFAAADLNGNVIAFRATATACDDTNLSIVTGP